MELILFDDGSTDGTCDWMVEHNRASSSLIQVHRVPERLGHTILYDRGISMSTRPIVGILHADMIIGPNYVENLLKHLKPGVVVCATRIEPPLHPSGPEKITMDFGQDHDNLDIKAFESYCLEVQQTHKDHTTGGMFAPWMIRKSDFDKVGGHDPLFAPFPYEDSDIFQRWMLAGYALVQSRDSLVYHLTCRGHRWTEQVGQDDQFYVKAAHKASRNYIRKWGSWIANTPLQHPIIPPKYFTRYIVYNAEFQLIEWLEPWCSEIEIVSLGPGHRCTVDELIGLYIEHEQPNTLYDLRAKFVPAQSKVMEFGVKVQIDGDKVDENDLRLLQQLQQQVQTNDEHIHSAKVGALTITTLKPKNLNNASILLTAPRGRRA